MREKIEAIYKLLKGPSGSRTSSASLVVFFPLAPGITLVAHVIPKGRLLKNQNYRVDHAVTDLRGGVQSITEYISSISYI